MIQIKTIYAAAKLLYCTTEPTVTEVELLPFPLPECEEIKSVNDIKNIPQNDNKIHYSYQLQWSDFNGAAMRVDQARMKAIVTFDRSKNPLLPIQIEYDIGTITQ